MKGACTIEECSSHAIARGYCSKHYTRWQRYGDPNTLHKLPNGTLRKWIEEHSLYEGDECLKWPFAINEGGYAQMSGCVPSRLMCKIRHGAPPTSSHHAAHSCGKGKFGCINPNHLYWATPLQNISDKKKHGTQPTGEKVYSAKLTNQQVREIRELAKVLPRHRIAAKYDVSGSCIESIINGRRWRHIT